MVAILFEGKTDKDFLTSLLEAYSLNRDQISFINFEGKDNLFNLSHPHYNNLETDISAGKIDKMLIIADADDEKDPSPYRGFGATLTKLCETIENLDFTIPVDYHIMCDENQQGHLESFLLSVLDADQKECIRRFKECYRYELTDKWAYNTFYKQMKHPFDYHHPNFDLLKSKLKTLFDQ